MAVAKATERRLTVIMMADVVGYSRMMEADEAGTLTALMKRRRSILEPTLRARGGRTVKVMGDGVLVEFTSAVNAVVGAFELQHKMGDANQSGPESRQILLRIGINLGDVIDEDADIFGEGVNIAARLEALGGARRHLHFGQSTRRGPRQSRIDGRGHGRGGAKEYCAASSCFSDWPNDSSCAQATGACSSQQTIDSSSAIREHERRRGTGIFRRRDCRRYHHRTVTTAGVLSSSPVIQVSPTKARQSIFGKSLAILVCAMSSREASGDQATDCASPVS